MSYRYGEREATATMAKNKKMHGLHRRAHPSNSYALVGRQGGSEGSAPRRQGMRRLVHDSLAEEDHF